MEPLDTFGFVVFALLMMVPGLALVELFSLGKEMSVAARSGLAFGLSLCVNAVVVAAFALSSPYLGFAPVVSPSLPYSVLVVSALGLVLIPAFRRRLPRPRPTRNDLLVFAITLFLGGFLYAYSLKYPIFPQFDSVDFRSHIQILTSLLSGVDVSQMPLYYGVHFQLLFANLLVGGVPLVVTQEAMDIIVFLSPLLFYAAGEVLLSQRAGLIAAFIYVFAGYLWFGGVFDSGLYPNFYGILASLTTLVLFAAILSGPSRRVWIPYVLSVANLYLSHYSSLAILAPALLVLSVIFFKEREKLLRGALAFVALISPAAVGYVLFPGLAQTTLAFLSGGQGGVLGDTPLSSQLVQIPVLRFAVAIIFSDYASVLLMGLALLGAFFVIRGNSYWAIPVFWLAALLVVAPQSGLAWRFSYVALVPLTLLASLGLDGALTKFARPARVKTSKLRRRRNPFVSWRRFALLCTVLVLLIIASTSWTAIESVNAVSETAVSNESQGYVYSAIMWMKSNLTSPGSILSVSDWRFTYSGILGGPPVGYTPLPDPSQVLNYSYIYLITTNVTTVSTQSPRSPYQIYTRSLPGSRLVYSNPDVQILEIKRG